MHADTLIQNATVYDGSGSRPFVGDVLLRGSSIHRIARRGMALPAEGAKVVDATGKILTPGFINLHSHSELQLLHDPHVYQVVGQGITTEVLGQDGFSVAPVTDAIADEVAELMDPLCGRIDRPFWWRSHADYFTEVEKADPACRYVGLAGYGTVRMHVAGCEKRPLTVRETAEVGALLEQCMEQGACGLSFGLIYPPSSFADVGEMTAAAKVMAKHDGLIMVHTRDEMNHILDAFDEMMEVVKESGARMEISHLKSLGPGNWGKVEAILERMEQMNAAGYEVNFDQYPWTAGSTGMRVMVPDWAYSGGVDAFEKRLEDPAAYQEILEGTREILHQRGTGTCVQVAEVPVAGFEWMSGLWLNEIAQRLDMDETEAVLHILRQTRSTPLCIYHAISEEDVCAIMQSPYHAVCTDGIVAAVPHPRAYSTYPRFLGRYVRDKKIMPLETAIAHITSEPARRLRLWDRGLVREGMSADLVLMDYDRVLDTNSYRDPVGYPEGICHVWVQGRLRYSAGDAQRR